MSEASNAPLLVVPNRRGLSLDREDESLVHEASPLPTISMREILRAIGRRIWPATTIVVVAVLGTFVYLLLTTPTYVAVSKVLVKVGREKLSPLAMSGGASSNFVFSEKPENVNDEIEILQSSSVIDRSFPALQAKLEEIDRDPANEAPPQTTIEWAKYVFRMLKRDLSEAGDWLLQTAKEPLYQIGFSQRLSPETLLREKLIKALGVAGVKETNVFSVSFSWSDPNYAAFALNTIMDAFQQEHMRVQSNLGGPIDFYQDQQKRVATELIDTNKKIEAYVKVTGSSDPVAEKQTQLTLIGLLERQLADNVVAVQQTRERMDAVRNSADGSSWPATPGVPQESMSGLVELDSRYAQLISNRNKLVAQWRADSPLVQDTDTQIARLRQQKQEALVNYLGDRIRIQNQAEVSIRGRLTEARAELNRLRDVEIGYLSLQAERDQRLTQLKDYEHQIGQLRVQRTLDSHDVSSVRVLNRASPPGVQSWPRKGLIMGLAALFGLLLAACYIMVMQFFDRTVSTERDLANVLGLPVVARIPKY